MSTRDIGAGRGHRAGSGPVADRPATGATWPAYAAAGWMVFFGLVHVYWAAGGTAALLVVHALPAVLVGAGLALGIVQTELTERDRLSLFVYEPYWLLGGVLFGLATAAAQRRDPAARAG